MENSDQATSDRGAALAEVSGEAGVCHAAAARDGRARGGLGDVAGPRDRVLGRGPGPGVTGDEGARSIRNTGIRDQEDRAGREPGSGGAPPPLIGPHTRYSALISRHGTQAQSLVRGLGSR